MCFQKGQCNYDSAAPELGAENVKRGNCAILTKQTVVGGQAAPCNLGIQSGSATCCVAQCQSGYEETSGRGSGVSYYCPDQIPSGSADAWQFSGANTDNQIFSYNQQDPISCSPVSCSRFSNADIQNSLDLTENLAVGSLNTRKFNIDECIRTQLYTGQYCSVSCADGYEGVSMMMLCQGLNDLGQSALSEFQGMDSSSVADAGNAPVCAGKKCTSYGGIESAATSVYGLPSDASNYDYSGCLSPETNSTCILRCLPGYTRTNTMLYRCLNRVVRGRADLTLSLIPEDYYTSFAVPLWTSLVDKLDSLQSAHLECPPEPCKWRSLSAAAGLETRACWGVTAGSSCHYDCQAG